MAPLLAQFRWQEVLASGVIGLGAATVAAAGMALLQKRPPSAVEGEPDTPPPARIRKPLAVLLIVVGLALAVAGFLWRTSLGL